MFSRNLSSALFDTYSQKLLSELEGKANELNQLTNEISDLKAELTAAKKELQSYQTPKRVSIAKTAASTDMSPTKKPMASQLERELSALREQNLQLQDKLKSLTKDGSMSPPKNGNTYIPEGLVNSY